MGLDYISHHRYIFSKRDEKRIAAYSGREKSETGLKALYDPKHRKTMYQDV